MDTPRPDAVDQGSQVCIFERSLSGRGSYAPTRSRWSRGRAGRGGFPRRRGNRNWGFGRRSCWTSSLSVFGGIATFAKAGALKRRDCGVRPAVIDNLWPTTPAFTGPRGRRTPTEGNTSPIKGFTLRWQGLAIMRMLCHREPVARQEGLPNSGCRPGLQGVHGAW